jgi:hypothetical protein
VSLLRANEPENLHHWRLAAFDCRGRQLQARVRAAVNQEGCTSVAQGRGQVIDSKDSEGQLPVPVVLSSIGIGVQHITDDTISQFHLGVGALVVGGAEYEAQAHALDKLPEHLTSELGVVICHSCSLSHLQRAPAQTFHSQQGCRASQLHPDPAGTAYSTASEMSSRVAPARP